MKEEKAITCAEAGAKGGATTRRKYGPDHYSKCGQRGGATTRDRYGKGHYAELGRQRWRVTRAAAAVPEASDE